MKRIARLGPSILLLIVVISQPAFAFSYPLSSEAIREAYFLGKADANKRADFFGKYTQQLRIPKKGVYVGVIMFETPYVVIAQQISHTVSNDFAPDAEQEFLGKPSICRVRVQVYFNYKGQTRIHSGGYKTNYSVRLTQNDKEISSQTNRTVRLYTPGPNSATAGLELDLEYDAGKIDSSMPANVEVLTSDGQDVQTTFDLDSLR